MHTLFLIAFLVPVSFAVKCHLCTDPNGDCTSKQPCEGNWCTLQIVHSEDSLLVSKGCSPTNALPSQHDDCIKSPPLGGRENVNCYCNSTDNCNTQEFVKQHFPKVLEFTVGAKASGAGAGAGANAGAGGSAGAGGDVSCFECKSLNGDCSTATCKGAFCVTKIVKNDKAGTVIVTKACEKENPIDKATDGCISSTTETTNIICSCRGGNNCNSKDNLEQLYAKVSNGASIFGGKSSTSGGKAEPEPNAEPKNHTKPITEPEPTINNGTQAEPEPGQKRPNAAGTGNNTLAAEPEPKAARPEPEKVPTAERNGTRPADSEKKTAESGSQGLLFGLISIVVPLAVAFC